MSTRENGWISSPFPPVIEGYLEKEVLLSDQNIDTF